MCIPTIRKEKKMFNPYVAMGGDNLPPPRTFYPDVAPKLLIVTKAFMTFPEYVCATNAEKISVSFQYGGWKIDTQLEKARKY